MVNTTTEPRFVVDADNRAIIVPQEMANLGVVLDNISETIIFELPNSFDGEDWSTKTCVVEYVNAKGGYAEDTVALVAEGADKLLASWLITDKLTRYAGVVRFAVSIRDTSTGYMWSTQDATANVLNGLVDGDSILGIDIATASQLLEEVDYMTSRFDDMQATITDIVDPSGTFAQRLAYLKAVALNLEEGEEPDEDTEYQYFIANS